jgi:hypothetical protein
MNSRLVPSQIWDCHQDHPRRCLSPGTMITRYQAIALPADPATRWPLHTSASLAATRYRLG